MQLEQFFRGMTLTRRATVQSPAYLRLPFRIILRGPPPQVLRQFQTLLRRQTFHGLFDLSNAHGANNAESRPFFNLFYRKGHCARGLPVLWLPAPHWREVESSRGET